MSERTTARTIREHWMEYVERVMPATAGPTQRQETRRAFYAGAQAALGALMDNVGDDPDEPATEDEEALLAGLIDECRQFGREVKAGRA